MVGACAFFSDTPKIGPNQVVLGLSVCLALPPHRFGSEGNCRRSIGHASSDAILSHLDIPLSRYAVPRWEQHLASTMIVMSRRWHDYHDKFLQASHAYLETLPPNAPRHLSYQFHLITADATNSKASRKTFVRPINPTPAFPVPKFGQLGCPPKPGGRTGHMARGTWPLNWSPGLMKIGRAHV